MKNIRKSKIFKALACYMALNLIAQAVIPSVSYALTAGPGSPEFASFEPVATTDMVNVFSGDFTYNLPVVEIPGPDGGGYALSLSYHSGGSAEEEASWVGFGWTLNPGAINRDVRGFPDDYNGAHVDYYNKVRPNWTMASSLKVNLEFFSQSKGLDGNTKYVASNIPSIGLGTALRFNNYQGFQRSYSLSTSFKGYGGLGMNIGGAGVTFSPNINPVKILNKFLKKGLKTTDEIKQKGANEFNKKDKEKTASFKDRMKAAGGLAANSMLAGLGSGYGLTTFSEAVRATSVSKYSGYNLNLSFGGQFNPSPGPVGIEGGYSGSFGMQHNQPKTGIAANGYMYNNISMGAGMSDYFVEKSQPFDKRDYFLGIPFSNPDNFMLTGEGLGGGFRMYSPATGHYYPKFVDSDVKIWEVGFEGMLGTNIGMGLNFGFGNQKTQIKNWGNTGNTDSYQFSGGDPVFRFNGDMGGKIEYADNELYTAKVTAKPKFPGIRSGYPNLNAGLNNFINNAANANEANSSAKRSSFIQPEKNANQLNGFTIYNEDGSRYRYGVPVYNKNDANISVDAKGAAIYDNDIVYKDLHLNNAYDIDYCEHKAVMGEVRKTQYATTYLLSEITSTDYIDRTNDGPTFDDFGGLTKFEYHQKYGGTNNWYRWRIPYTGLSYHKNQISDVKDDMASLSTGEKEVNYLKKIETKTHLAYFVTNKSVPARFDADPASAIFLSGSDKDRFDGLGAPPLAATDPAANNDKAKGSSDLEYLEKIVLFAKARPDKPLKTTYFEYDYSIAKNLPNNVNGSFPGNDLSTGNVSGNVSGKLTLKRMWSEYESTVSARISPYQFSYQYKDIQSYSNELINENPNLASFFNLSNTFSNQAQNPEYKPYLLDSWGNNQPFAQIRHQDMQPWVYQGKIPPAEQFDPAAWQLKQIKLPSGGEILIEYEQKDYSYIQDRNPMAMASITGYDETKGGLANKMYAKEPWYEIKVEDLGLDPASANYAAEATELVSKIYEHYVTNSNRIYFKFLYDLKGEDPRLNNCQSEYISGYAKVIEIDEDNNAGVRLTDDNKIRITLDGSGNDDDGYAMVPRQGCYDFYSTQRVGKYESGCEGVYEAMYDNTVSGIAKGDDCSAGPAPDLLQILAKFGFAILAISDMAVGTLADLRIQIPIKSTVCKEFNKELSYLKIPMIHAKRGGGIRVKRLLMYDKGIETGDAAIYGSEYHYVTEDGKSSGVATTEPSPAREENPLVEFMPKNSQSWFSRHTVGKDKEQSEGPLGESILPSPSVGHSRVLIHNIHTGRSGTGFVIHEFNTVKDYPYDKPYLYDALAVDPDREFEDFGTVGTNKGVDMTNLADNTKKDYMIIPAGVFNYTSSKLWAAQGFRFIINQMHGQPKSVRTYGGEPALLTGSPDKKFLTSAQSFEYYEPGEKIKMMKPDGTYGYDIPGKEMDLTMEMRSIKDNTLDFSLELDISAGVMFPPPIFVGLWPSFSYTEEIMSSHATSKIIRYPVIQKSVTTFQDGIESKTENLAFAETTGKTILTRTTDAYHGIANDDSYKHDGSFYNFTIPAFWHYQGMGSKVENIANTNQLSASAGSVVTYGSDANLLDGSGVWAIPQDKIVSASANTFNNSGNITSWSDDNITGAYNSGSYSSQLAGIWKPHANYVYKTDVLNSGNPLDNRIYEGGVYTGFSLFDYDADLAGIGQVDMNWLKLNEVTKYSPNGNVLEEKNILGIYSAAKFGYNFTQPVMIAQNAQYADIYFNDYEINTGAIAHSGKGSQLYSAGITVVNNVSVTDHLSAMGGLLKLWLHSSNPVSGELSAAIGASVTPVVLEKVAQSGEWILFSATIKPEALPVVGDPFSINISYSGTGAVYIDDVRFQPVDASATCRVYDVNTLKPIVEFDDMHFGLYYQYNGEGKLVRKIIETERGIKTVQETQYNTPQKEKR